jgi:hypothetical protein
MNPITILQSPVARALDAAWHAYVEADARLKLLDPDACTVDREAVQHECQVAFAEYRRAAAAFDHVFFVRLACSFMVERPSSLAG